MIYQKLPTLLRRWWRNWANYVGVQENNGRLAPKPDGPSFDDDEFPEHIRNNDLLDTPDDHTSLKPMLREGPDFVILSEGSWEYLSKLYGEASLSTHSAGPFQIMYRAWQPSAVVPMHMHRSSCSAVV